MKCPNCGKEMLLVSYNPENNNFSGTFVTASGSGSSSAEAFKYWECSCGYREIIHP